MDYTESVYSEVKSMQTCLNAFRLTDRKYAIHFWTYSFTSNLRLSFFHTLNIKWNECMATYVKRHPYTESETAIQLKTSLSCGRKNYQKRLGSCSNYAYIHALFIVVCYVLIFEMKTNYLWFVFIAKGSAAHISEKGESSLAER